MRFVTTRLYAAFPAGPFGGNMAGVVYDEGALTDVEMQAIAKDLALPTTGFVKQIGDTTYATRFFSSRAEMPMCGHVTVGVFAALYDDGRIPADHSRLTQRTAAGDVAVEIERNGDYRDIYLYQRPPVFDTVALTATAIAPHIGLVPERIVGVTSCNTD